MTWKLDGWQNILTGLGIAGKDKKMSSALVKDSPSQDDIEVLYSMSDIAEKIVDYLVEDAFKKEVRFTSTEDVDGTLDTTIKEYLTTKNFFPKFIQAAKYGRLYGGGFLIFGIDDGQTPDKELVMEGIKAVNWVNPLSRYDLTAKAINLDASSELFKNPEKYELVGLKIEDGKYGKEIHSTRLVRFDGAFLPEKLYKKNGYYHDSVLTKVKDKIRDYDTAFDSVSTLLHDFSQAKFKMKGLSNLLSSGKEDLVMQRLQLIDTKRSLIRAVVLDEGEEFERDTTNLSGVGDILSKFGEKLTAASNMPHTILLGEGSTGNLSGAGESEMTTWYDYVSKKQMSDYKPKLLKAVSIMLASKDSPTKGAVPIGFDVEFPPLKQMTEKEIAEIYKMTAEGDQIYIVNQVLDPDEVAINRFTEREFNQKTTIDETTRSPGSSSSNETTEE